jgi:hypothetical protein
VKLVDQWAALETELPETWREIRLTLRTEQADQLARAAQVLGPMNPGRVGDALVVDVRRAGGPAGPEAARRLFGRLDGDRVWCTLEAGEVTGAGASQEQQADDAASSGDAASAWDVALATLPDDWSDLLCSLQIGSSALLPRAALLCAPVNPTRDPGAIGFTFRCARTKGYGASPAMVRRCLERLDAEGIDGAVTILRTLSDTQNVATQGPVWLVDGRVL